MHDPGGEGIIWAMHMNYCKDGGVDLVKGIHVWNWHDARQFFYMSSWYAPVFYAELYKQHTRMQT